VWNAMRALDYLEMRPDVDKSRMGVTGLSGGGAMSWFLGAADERVKCIVPVCQTGSIEQLVTDRATDGHCDCAFWINYHQWCTPDIGALIAPRALLVASGTDDIFWRPYAFRDVVHRIRRQYAELGAPNNAALMEDLSPHGYTPKLRQAIFSWFNLHLKNSGELVRDDVTAYIEPEANLLVFGGKPPAKNAMRKIDLILPRLAVCPRITGRKEWRKHQLFDRFGQLLLGSRPHDIIGVPGEFAGPAVTPGSGIVRESSGGRDAELIRAGVRGGENGDLIPAGAAERGIVPAENPVGRRHRVVFRQVGANPVAGKHFAPEGIDRQPRGPAIEHGGG
ncbi:MAG: hypothetical protein EOM10_18355, partial [Opitutae bacterium]|nr:hypothetical protein [Opitutae bacterium]